MSHDIKPGEVTAAITYIFALAFFLFLLSGISGCGDADGFGTNPGQRAPTVDIQCDATSCTILVHDADTITTWHDGVFYWHEDWVSPDRRYTNRDIAPEVSITVEACNEAGCTERTLVVLEVAGTTCRTTCVDLPLGPECTTVCEDTYV